MLGRLGRAATACLYRWSFPGRAYAWGRSILATATLLTLATNSQTTLFPVRSGGCREEELISLFCLTPETWIWLAKASSVLVLAVVASGFAPRVTGLLHWWVSHSLAASSRTIDGGDQLAANITLLLVPITLVDRRLFHWVGVPFGPFDLGTRQLGRALVWYFAFAAVRLQMVIVYLEAALGKLWVAEWRDGTAMYYWLLDPSYGLPNPLRPLFVPLLRFPAVVASLTWLVIGIEAFLAVALFLPNPYRRLALVMGAILHGLIAVVLGLPSFSLIMFGGLLLYLWRPATPYAVGVSITVSNCTEITGEIVHSG